MFATPYTPPEFALGQGQLQLVACSIIRFQRALTVLLYDCMLPRHRQARGIGAETASFYLEFSKDGRVRSLCTWGET